MSNPSQTPTQHFAVDQTEGIDSTEVNADPERALVTETGELGSSSDEPELEDVIAQLVQNQDSEQQVLQDLTAEIDSVRRDLTGSSDANRNPTDLHRIESHLIQLEEHLVDMKASLVARDSLVLARLDKAASIDANIATLRAGLREALIGFQHAFKLRDEQHSEGLTNLTNVQKEHFEVQLQTMGTRLSEVGSEIARRSNEIISRGFRAGLEALTNQVEQLQQRLDLMKSESDVAAERLADRFDDTTSTVTSLLDQSRDTAQSAEIIANAFHDLQIDVAAIRQSTTSDRNDPIAEQNLRMLNALYELQAQLEQVQVQVTTQGRKLEQAEIERQAHDVVPEEKSYGTTLFYGAVLLLLLLNAVIGVGVYSRLTGAVFTPWLLP